MQKKIFLVYINNYDKCNKKEKLPTQKIGNPKDAKTTRKKFKSKSKSPDC